MNRKLKVLQLQNRYNVCASDLAEQIVKGLPTERFDVTSAFFRGSPKQGEPESCAGRSLYFRFAQSDLKGLRLRALWQLYKHCRDEKYDAVIVHRFKPIHMMLLLNRFLNIKACIGVQHGIGDFDRAYRRWEIGKLIDARWRIVGVSRAVCNYLVGLGSGFDSGNVVQINNAIDIEKAAAIQLSPSEARAALGLPEGVFIFGTIGRLVPVKGHVYAIEAIARLKERYPDAHLAIIGEGRERSVLEALIERHGLQDRVHLLGARDDALQYVKAFDVFVMPSLSEGLPLAMLEGMSGELPIIGSDIASLKSILDESGSESFRCGESSDLADSMSRLLELSSGARAEIGRKTYRYLCEAHDVRVFRHRYRELVELLLK